MKHIFLLFILWLSVSFCLAQELIIKNVEVKSNDLSARTSQSLDLNDNPYAPVKVRIALNDVKFSGSIIGEVDEGGMVYHPTNVDFYGVTLNQAYTSDRYHDDGNIFLLWDFFDESHLKIMLAHGNPIHTTME